jgi:hypothetical protein
MSTISRRTLLTGTALALPFALAGCPGSAVPTLSTLANYALVAENAAGDVLKALPVTATTTEAIQYLTTAEATAQAVVNAAPATGSSFAQEAYDAIKAALPIIGPLVSVFPLAGDGVAALEVILPLIASAAGLVGAAPYTPPAFKGVPVMTIDAAMAKYSKK